MDNVAATEIRLWIENNEPLYRQGLMILKNLYRKHKRGILDKAKAPKLLMYLVEAGLKSYAKEYGDAKEWSKLLSVADRKELAAELAKEYIEQIESGEFERGYPELVGKKGLADHDEEDAIRLPRWIRKGNRERAQLGLKAMRQDILAGGTINALQVAPHEFYILVTQPFGVHTASGQRMFRIGDYTFFCAALLDTRLSKKGTIRWKGMDSIEHALERIFADSLDLHGISYRIS